MKAFFHEAQRELQRRMESVRIADRIESTRRHAAFNAADSSVIESAQFFFIATSAPDGTLDCSIKCGPAGFIRIASQDTLVFPDYDGNGMFRTLGNIEATAGVALLFVEFWGEKRKIRIQGRAALCDMPELLKGFPGAQLAVKVVVNDIFPNCPRYLPSLIVQAQSEYVEALGKRPLEPAWKSKPDLTEYVHPRRAC